MNLSDELRDLLWLPGTANEMAAILDKPRRTVQRRSAIFVSKDMPM